MSACATKAYLPGRETGKGAILLLFTLVFTPAAATPPGTDITNIASARYEVDWQGELNTESNPVSILTTVIRTPSSLIFHHNAPGDPRAESFRRGLCEFSRNGSTQGPFSSQGPPLDADGGVIGSGATLHLVPGLVYHRGETVFLSLDDQDQNLSAEVLESVLVGIESSEGGTTELLRLWETEANSGRFLGWLTTVEPAADAEYDGRIGGETNIRLIATYVDIDDPLDFCLESVPIDPYGRVFGSADGNLLDGVEITLMNVLSGEPARVYADDGQSTFPSTIRSGAVVMDGAGVTHDFPPGAYRFPVVEPGEYILEVRPPPGHRAPSHIADASLQNLPGAPFFLDPAGSRGLSFYSGPSRSFQVDLPVDSLRSAFTLSKQADRDRVGLGEYLAYELELTNGGEATLPAPVLEDRFPAGFRFEPGSARNGAGEALTPIIDADGGGFVLELDSLAAGESWRMQYVLAVGPAARLGRVENRAWAVAGGLRSNNAIAVVRVEADPIADRCRVLGRVVARDAEGAVSPLAGQRIYLADGRYALTDAEGRYHFEDLEPGGHLLRLDPGTIPEWLSAPSEHCRRLLDLQAGSLWREDFTLMRRPAPQGSVDLALRASLAGDSLRTHLDIQPRGLPLSGRRLLIMPPDDARALPASLRLNGLPLAADVLQEGQGYVEIALPGTQAADTTVALELVFVLPAADAMPASASTAATGTLRAVLRMDDPANPEASPISSPPLELACEQEQVRGADRIFFYFHPRFSPLSATLSPEAQERLDAMAAEFSRLSFEELRVIGHSDNIPVGNIGRLYFPNNEVLSLARARAVIEHLGRRLELPADRLNVEGVGPKMPLASNSSAAGRAINRRVEIQLLTPNLDVDTHWRLTTAEDLCRLELRGTQPGEVPAPRPAIIEAGPARFDSNWLETAADTFAWLWPPAGHHPPIASLKIVCQRPADWKLELNLNGKPVGALNHEGLLLDSEERKALDRWTGVDLLPGQNIVELIALDAEGVERKRESRQVHVSGPPVRAELLPASSELLADGRSPIRIALRLLDAAGHPAREGVVGRWSVSSPQIARENSGELEPGSIVKDRLGPSYQVGRDGVVVLELEPSSVAGETLIRLPLAKGDHTLPLWLRPALRPWILLCFAEGGIAHRRLSGDMEGLANADLEEEWDWDGRLSLFARGRVRGRWLLTMAFNSEREFTQDSPGFSSGQGPDPEAWYTVYGDDSRQGEDAPSARRLYLKLEGETAMALFGDFETGFGETQLASYGRRLNGFRGSVRHGPAELDLFAAEGPSRFVKDELLGGGHSGPYALSRRDILPRSERIWLETRDRLRPERIITRRELTRDLDYQLDSALGTLRFKAPVPAHETGFNPVVIVVDYEVRGDGERLRHLGMRAQLDLPSERGVCGLTMLEEGDRGGDVRLAGVDLRLDLWPGMQLRAETARSWGGDSSDRDGAAMHIELERRDIAGRELLSFHESEPGFGLGQQRVLERAKRRVSFELERALPSGMRAELLARRENDLNPGGPRRDLAESRLGREFAWGGLGLGLRGEGELLADGGKRKSAQLLASADWRRKDDRLRLELEQEQILGGDSVPGYPSRTMLGARARLHRDWTLVAEQEILWPRKGESAAAGSRLGLEAKPWRGAGLEAGAIEEAGRLFTLVGLRQSWRLSERWSLDLGFERQDRLSGAVTTAPAPATGLAEEAFSAGHIGAGWEGGAWSADGRLELRDGDTEELGSLQLGVFGEPKAGWGLLARLRGLRTQVRGGLEIPDQRNDEDNLRLGLARRPVGARWIWLQRLDLSTERRTRSLSEETTSRRVVSRGNINLRTGARGQISLMLAARHLSERLAAIDLVGFSGRLAIEGRWEFARGWDAGLRVGIRHALSLDATDLGLGISAGRRIGRQFWLGAGYNVAGYRDRDFAAGDYTAAGPYLRLRVALDEEDLRHALQR